MQAKLITTFDRLSEPDFLAKAGAIVTALIGNTHYPEPWEVQVPTLAQLTAAFNAYQDGYHTASTRDTARQELTDLFKRLAPYLVSIAQGDTSILATTGFDLRDDPRPFAYDKPVQWCFELMKASPNDAVSERRILDYRKRAIFVVHGIGSHQRDTTAVFLREGFEDALDNLHKKGIEEEIDDPSFENLPSTYIKEGYWGDYGEFEQCFPDLWEKMSDTSQNYFKVLWKSRTESVIGTAGWFAKQALKLICRAHKFDATKCWPIRILIYFPRLLIILGIVLLIWVTLLILLVIPTFHQFIIHYLGDVRLYLEPKGSIEHAIVQRIDQKVRDDFLRLLGVDSEFEPLPDTTIWGDEVNSGLHRLRIGDKFHRFDEVTWVAHSLGTVVSYNVISELLYKCQRIRHLPDFAQDVELIEKVERVEKGLGRFYTLGSPLQMIKVLFPKVLKDWPKNYANDLDHYRESTRKWKWVNFRHICDPISGYLKDFPNVQDCQTKLNWAWPGLAHIRYWHTDSICEYILAQAQPSLLKVPNISKPKWPKQEWWQKFIIYIPTCWLFYKFSPCIWEFILQLRWGTISARFHSLFALISPSFLDFLINRCCS